MSLAASSLAVERAARPAIPPFTAVRFSIPAYLCAVLAGSEFSTLSFVLAAAAVWNGPALLLAAVTVAPILALIATIVFLPAALLTLRIASVWRVSSRIVFGLLSGGLSLLTAVLFGILMSWEQSSTRNAALMIVGIVAVGGFVGGIVYRWVYGFEHRKSEP